MVDSIALEIKSRTAYLEEKTLETIYFGGGTPSILTHEELSQLMNTIHENYSVSKDAEITLESNPDDITESSLEDWKNVGINRLSIGLQSFKESDLKWMNRAHTVNEGLSCVGLAQEAGINNITVDLIYGLPGLTLEEWKSHIKRVVDFGVPHISAYCLTVEEKTALHSLVKKGKIQPPGDDLQSDQFSVLSETLTKEGFEHYEISNFGKTGFESKHNSNYWKGEWYLGVGPSAHSFNGDSRSWNIANNNIYMKSIKDEVEYSEVEFLTKEDQFNECILIGLRTSYGVELSKLKSISDLDEAFNTRCSDFINEGWMVSDPDKLSLTKEGRLRADYIASELFIAK